MSFLDSLLDSLTTEVKVAITVAVATGVIAAKILLKRSPPAKIKEPALNPKEYRKFKLQARTEINHNTRLYRFALPNPDDVLGLPIGQHLSLKAIVDGKEIYRSYTPVSSDDELGYFDLLIKVYEKGAMSQYIDKLKIGDDLDVRGPKGLFVYRANMLRAIGMIAGGTGITPMLQVIRAVVKNPDDKTEVHLIFANVAESDILLKEELDGLAAKHKNFHIYYVLNVPPEGWKGGVGFVSQEMIEQQLPKPAADIKIVMCGPTPMNKAMMGHLQAIGYPEEQTFTF
jgi:cytochrome-b5 reductase